MIFCRKLLHLLPALLLLFPHNGLATSNRPSIRQVHYHEPEANQAAVSSIATPVFSLRPASSSSSRSRHKQNRLKWKPSSANTQRKTSQEELALAFDLVIDSVEFSHQDLAKLQRVNRGFRKTVAQKPVWKYFFSQLPHAECLNRMHLQFHHRPPTSNNPIRYLFNFEDLVDDKLYMFDELLKNDVECLDSLLRKKTPIVITTCYHPNATQFFPDSCSNFTGKMVDSHIFVGSSLITSYMGLPNSTLSKRVLLSGAITYEKPHITEYLLNLNLDPDQEEQVNKEHLALALFVGNDKLFHHLIEPYINNPLALRTMFTFDTEDEEEAVVDGNIQDILDLVLLSRDLPQESLEFFLTVLPLHPRRLHLASQYNRPRTLHTFLQRASTQFAPQFNEIVVDCLSIAAEHGYHSILSMLFNHINTKSIKKSKREEIARKAKESKDQRSIALVWKKLGLKSGLAMFYDLY